MFPVHVHGGSGRRPPAAAPPAPPPPSPPSPPTPGRPRPTGRRPKRRPPPPRAPAAAAAPPPAARLVRRRGAGSRGGHRRGRRRGGAPDGAREGGADVAQLGERKEVREQRRQRVVRRVAAPRGDRHHLVGLPAADAREVLHQDRAARRAAEDAEVLDVQPVALDARRAVEAAAERARRLVGERARQPVDLLLGKLLRRRGEDGEVEGARQRRDERRRGRRRT